MRGFVIALAALLLWAGDARADGLTVTATQALSARDTEYTVTSPAMGGTTHLRVLLPAGYAAEPQRRYPVLLLLHGWCDDYRSWVDKGSAEALTAPYPLIVVMPDGGSGGWYSDPYNAGAFGPPRYETYTFNELLPWVDATFRTIAGREGRAVAGLSMGGFGALSYAARHPDAFVAAGSFSGVVDAPGFAQHGFANLIPNAVWGPLATELPRWQAHNPLDLAAQLAPLRDLELRYGNGQPGPLDTRTGTDTLEAEVHRENVALDAKLTTLGIPHVLDDYGPGVHDWPYWARDLQRFLPDAMAVLATGAGADVGGTVPATLSLTLGPAPSLGPLVPGVARDYSASLVATVTSTAGDATLTASDPSTTAPGHLVNGAFALASPLQVGGAPVPSTLEHYAVPVSNDVSNIPILQSISATEPLRTGTYAKTFVFTLSTTQP
jgi:S-formylglutathione hydrolase FrmB